MLDKKAFIKLVAEAEKIFRNEKELTDLDLDGAGGKTVSNFIFFDKLKPFNKLLFIN